MEFPLYYITWNMTCRCNLRCKHCYNEFADRTRTVDEMSTKEGIKIIDQGISLGLRAILFTGGEPLLRRDLINLMEYAKQKNLLVFLATNGTLINDVFVKKAKGLIDKINISLDAGHQNKHDMIRGVKGSFNKSLKAISILKKNFKVSIAFTVHSENLVDLRSVASIAKKKNVPLVIKRFIPIGQGKKEKSLILSCDSYKILIKEIRLIKKNQEVSFSDPFPLSFNKSDYSYGGCLAGIYSLSIDFNGNIYPCTKLKVLVGNIRKDSLEKVWKQSKILKKLRERDLKGKCRECKKIWSCGGCRAAAYAEKGDFLAEDPLCFY